MFYVHRAQRTEHTLQSFQICGFCDTVLVVTPLHLIFLHNFVLFVLYVISTSVLLVERIRPNIYRIAAARCMLYLSYIVCVWSLFPCFLSFLFFVSGIVGRKRSELFCAFSWILKWNQRHSTTAVSVTAAQSSADLKSLLCNGQHICTSTIVIEENEENCLNSCFSQKMRICHY